MSDSRSSAPVRLRRRTEVMHERLNSGNKNHNNLTHLEINQVSYRILDGTVTDFNSEKLISIGAYDRELIVLDPSSIYLKTKYKQLVKLIGKKTDTQIVLDQTIEFIRKQFNMDLQNKSAEVDKLCSNPQNKLAIHQQSPVISLNIFLTHHIGVCRHHGLIICYLLHRLILDEKLPAGHVYLHRINLEKAAHVWAIYKPISPIVHANQDLYLVDSLWNTKAFNIKHHEAALASKRYGINAIFECKSRYSVPDHYEPKFSDYFIRFLLQSSAENCRKFLNQQFQHQPTDLAHIRDELINGKYHTKYAKDNNYQCVIDDIQRVMNTNLFHREDNYAEIKNADEEQQYILGLLYKSAPMRSQVIQSQSIDDLMELKATLTHSSKEKKFLFQTCPNYQELKTEVESLLSFKINELCAKEFYQIDNLVDKRRFVVFNILQKSPAERALILKRQNDASLNQIKAIIKDLSDGSAPYQTVLQEINQIEKQTALNIIQLVRDIILLDEFKIEITNSWVPNFHGKKIEANGNVTRIPKSFEKIFSLINEVKLESASLETLAQLIKNIEASAQKSNKPYDWKRKHKFLNLLRNANDKQFLLEHLHAFYNQVAPISMKRATYNT